MKYFFKSSSGKENIWRKELCDIKCINCNKLFKADTIRVKDVHHVNKEMFNIYMKWRINEPKKIDIDKINIFTHHRYLKVWAAMFSKACGSDTFNVAPDTAVTVPYG